MGFPDRLRIMITEFDITGPESAASLIGPINFQMKLTE